MLRRAFHTLNAGLARLGLRLERVSRDLDDRLVEPRDVAELARRLADAFDAWAASQQVFPDLATGDTAAKVGRFYEVYLASPYRATSGGSRLNNLVFLHLVADALKPTLIIDSGTHEGASAFALASGAPAARTLSFDIDLSRLKRREPGVVYVETDWTAHDLAGADLSRALGYFDDHLDQIRRLLEAQRAHVPYAIFDDDFPLTAFAAMAHGGQALPKLEFALDPALAGRDRLTFRERGVERRWPVDQAYLAKARAAIAATDRLPNTSLVTGIHQTPYRVVRIKQA